MDIRESVDRILEQRDTLADLFYLVFLDRFPEVRGYFGGVHWKQQTVLLTMALMVIERHHADNFPATALYLQYLGSKHEERGIPVELYPKFTEALIAALERFHGKEWNDRLADHWHKAIDRAVQAMLEGYSNPMSV